MKKLVTILFLWGILSPDSGIAQISITSSSFTYSQDFNTLSNSGTSSTLPSGWVMNETGTGADVTYAAGTGSGNTGNTYSFGASGNSERALGGLRSGSVVPSWGVSFTNNSGSTLIAMSISFIGEQWRIGVTNRNAADKIDFQYSLDATNLSTGTWVDVNSLDFSSPIVNGTTGALDGNASANRTTLTGSISGVQLPNNGTIWLRWSDADIVSSDDGLAIDDFTISSVTLPIELADFTAQTSNGDVTLNWQTISEINSDVFEVQHLVGGEWKTVATVQAAGASTDVRSYTQAVKGLQVGTHYFRLKSVDKDGSVKYSKQISVSVEVPGTFVMNPAYPNPFNPQTTLTFAVSKKQAVTMTLFNALGQQVSVLYQGAPEANTLQTVQLNGSNLQSGAYFVRLTGENFSGMQKVMLVK